MSIPTYPENILYFVSSTTKALLRKDGGTHDVFLGDAGWQQTETIMQYMIGEENNVEPVSEAHARVHYPAAFALEL